jgi:hypothetical protein
MEILTLTGLYALLQVIMIDLVVARLRWSGCYRLGSRRNDLGRGSSGAILAELVNWVIHTQSGSFKTSGFSADHAEKTFLQDTSWVGSVTVESEDDFLKKQGIKK